MPPQVGWSGTPLRSPPPTTAPLGGVLREALDEAATPPVVLAPCRERLETLSDAVIDSVVC